MGYDYNSGIMFNLTHKRNNLYILLESHIKMTEWSVF